jgi:hypothetical protein
MANRFTGIAAEKLGRLGEGEVYGTGKHGKFDI